jgi:hypothetical protein
MTINSEKEKLEILKQIDVLLSSVLDYEQRMILQRDMWKEENHNQPRVCYNHNKGSLGPIVDPDSVPRGVLFFGHHSTENWEIK